MPNPLGRLMAALSAGVGAFREAITDADPLRSGPGALADDWDGWQARRVRYALYWAFYQNDVYSKIRQFSTLYKRDKSLYRHLRGVNNPSARIAHFFRTHLQGGSLDHDAGDGKAVPSALPIEAADDGVRAAIARLWWDSDWEAKKGLYTLWGPLFGDVALKVCDEPSAGLVALDVVHPGTLEWVERGSRGEVTGYVRREWRHDPRQPPPTERGRVDTRTQVEFCETARLDGGAVRYATYLQGSAFDWNPGPDGRPLGTGPGARPAWDADYGFVPLFLCRHAEIGRDWGMGELELGRAKFDEVNDLGSKLNDQIRRAVEGAWYFAGADEPKAPNFARTQGSAANPEPGRQEMKAIWGGEASVNSQPYSLVGDLDIGATSAAIRQALDGLEDDYPELRFERLRTGGTISGAAIRVARQPASARIEERRPAYDKTLVTAQMAALAIGGHRGYPGYEGFDLATFDLATPNHRIGRRPVFAVETLDLLEEKQARYLALKTATDAGVPLAAAAKDVGFDEETVAGMVAERDADQQKAAAAAAAQQQQAEGDASAMTLGDALGGVTKFHKAMPKLQGLLDAQPAPKGKK